MKMMEKTMNEKLHLILAKATNQWMDDHHKSIEDAIGEVHIFSERLRVAFELIYARYINEQVDNIQSEAHDDGC